MEGDQYSLQKLRTSDIVQTHASRQIWGSQEVRLPIRMEDQMQLIFLKDLIDSWEIKLFRAYFQTQEKTSDKVRIRSPTSTHIMQIRFTPIQKAFRFLNFQVEHETFLNIVKENWEEYMAQPYLFYDFHGKLKRVRKILLYS